LAAKGLKKQAESRLKGARERMYHDLIFESAEQVFGARGYEQTTMQELATEAGISLKTLYTAFPGKRELYDEIQAVRGRVFVDQVTAATREGNDAIDRLDRLVGAYVGFLFDHTDWLQIHLRERVAWGLGPLEEEADGYWQRGLANMLDTIRGGIDEGVFHEGDSETLAMMATAVMQVQISRAVARGEADPAATTAEINLMLQRLLCTPAASQTR
jgi:AcrR family transcriptional regulator